MSQAHLPSSSLLTEGLLEERLGANPIPKVLIETGSAQAEVRHDSAIHVEPSLSRFMTAVIAKRETPHAGVDTGGVVDTGDAVDTRDGVDAIVDVGPAPMDITSETNLQEPPASPEAATPKPIEIPRPSQSDAWTTVQTGNTDDETLNWLEAEIAKQKVDNGTSASKGTSAQKQKQTDPPQSSSGEERSPKKVVSSEPDDKVIIHRGFSGLLAPPEPAALGERRISFPPLSNLSYNLTTYGLDPKVRKISSEGIAVYESNTPLATANPKGGDRESHTLDGNLSGPSSVHSNVASPEPVISNDGAATQSVVSSDNLEFCTKCKKNHIRPGSLATLEERDTCRSMLPDWFPTERFDKPWEAFTDLINRYVRASQMTNGTEENSEAKAPWSMEFHEPSDEWKEVGRFGGWWKCRIEVQEGEADIPTIERNCQLCRRRKVENDKLAAKKVETAMEKKQAIEGWIDKHMKKVMVKDRAFVKARLATEGF